MSTKTFTQKQIKKIVENKYQEMFKVLILIIDEQKKLGLKFVDSLKLLGDERIKHFISFMSKCKTSRIIDFLRESKCVVYMDYKFKLPISVIRW